MNSGRVIWLNSEDPPSSFPRVSTALTEPDGLLAAGGDLSTERLLYAYRHGIFPWYDEGQPLLWWSPIRGAFSCLATIAFPGDRSANSNNPMPKSK